MTTESTNKNPSPRQRRSHRKQKQQAILDGTLIPAKPVITHKPRKKAYVVPTAIPVVEFENIVYENPLIIEPVEIHSVLTKSVWDYTPSKHTGFDCAIDEYEKPQQRKRRKHKEPTEQYRKESKWQ
ncbi:hypothetical protein IFT48_18415 [Pseudomonas fluorescens]|uniref:hypothetical protein n=1 Tax=Pseudomonas fluorescens TaxID=294 RepID=UPI0019052B6A|nr:hypothetical protein [Pseudomonas fluorescens]MBD8091973.1 hypothetical protein [Pseudomonas fluorescens]MBD8718270.1 hypothetical protein [Pseudomonas fluorescens]